MIGVGQRSKRTMAARTTFSHEKPSTADRPSLFVFESNLRVLNYLKRTFSALYELRLFSEEALFLRDLDGTHRPSLILLAWDGLTQSMPPDSPRVRATSPEVPVLMLATTAEMHGLRGVCPAGRQRRWC